MLQEKELRKLHLRNHYEVCLNDLKIFIRTDLYPHIEDLGHCPTFNAQRYGPTLEREGMNQLLQGYTVHLLTVHFFGLLLGYCALKSDNCGNKQKSHNAYCTQYVIGQCVIFILKMS